MNHHSFFALILLVLAGQVLSAAPAFTIAGIVHDGTGGRIPNAHVTVLPANQPAIEAVAGTQGDFRVTVPAAGTYQVQVSADGFAPLAVTANVTDSEPAVNLDLALQIAVSSQTVEVTAESLAAETTST